MSDHDHSSPTVVFAGGDATSLDMLNIVVDPQTNSLKKNLQFTVTVLKGGAGAYFQYRLLNEKGNNRKTTSHPMPVADHTSIATAVHLKYLNTADTGVYLHWDESKTGGTFLANMHKGDEYTFTAMYNYGITFNAGDTNTAHQYVECAGRGACDYASGLCKCQPGYGGDACQRSECLRRPHLTPNKAHRTPSHSQRFAPMTAASTACASPSSGL